MAVAFDKFQASATGTGTLTISFVPVGTPRAVIVFVVQNVGTGDEVTSVTYGSKTLTEVTGSPNLHTTGEPGGVHAFFAGTGIPSGNQTVTVNVTATGSTKIAYCVTLTASRDTWVQAVDATVNSTSQANPSVTLSVKSVASFAAIAFHSGQNAPSGITPLGSWTGQNETDFGNQTCGCYTFDTVGTSDVTAGWTQTADDATMIALAITEASLTPTVGALTLSGTSPSLKTDTLRTPSAGSLVLSGTASSLKTDLRQTVVVGAIALTGATPSVITGKPIALGAGALVLTGSTPTLEAGGGETRTPSVGAVEFSGATPSLFVATILQLGAGALAMTGATPLERVDTFLTPARGALSGVGAVPTVKLDLRLSSGVGAVTITGAVPTLELSTALTPVTGPLTATGSLPSLRSADFRTPSTGALVLSGAVPEVLVPFVTPTTGGLVLVGATPALAVSEVSPPAPPIVERPSLPFSIYVPPEIRARPRRDRVRVAVPKPEPTPILGAGAVELPVPVVSARGRVRRPARKAFVREAPFVLVRPTRISGKGEIACPSIMLLGTGIFRARLSYLEDEALAAVLSERLGTSLAARKRLAALQDEAVLLAEWLLDEDEVAT